MLMVCLTAAAIGLAGWSSTGAQDEPKKLPTVFVIGDSISIGYTPPLTKLLAGKAVVKHNPGNAQDTRFGVKSLAGWLKGERPDIIHFNWGLWDLVDGGKAVPIDEYEKNLKQLVGQLKETKATLIWASTTPVPQVNGRKRRDADVQAYNAVAKKIMDENGIAIDDLYTVAKGKLDQLQTPNDVHFTKKGSEDLAEAAAATILKTLSTK